MTCIAENELKKMTNEQKYIRQTVLRAYDRAKHRKNVENRICKKFGVDIITLTDWLNERNHFVEDPAPEPKGMKIQNGYSHWISRICEEWMKTNRNRRNRRCRG